MAKNVIMYAVPEPIVSVLQLTAIRRSDGRGLYLLSTSDLRPYGVDRALSEGAMQLTADEAKSKFKPLNP